jgi:release factor glutamine methyltransferase
LVKKYSQLYLDARRRFMLLEEEQTASLLARSLLSYVSGKTNEQIISDRETYASEEVCKQMETAVSRIIAGEPLAYVLGEWSFYGLTFHIDKNVLIPRDDTCAVTQLAIKRGLYLEQDPRILDLCTGSGCIGIAVANRVKDARVTLADISEAALSVAKKNVDRHQLSGRVSCVRVDALAAPPEFLGKYDMIISNPPYITTREMEELDRSVKDHEPHLALHGGEDGLDFYRSIAENYTAILKEGGYLCLEYDPSQGDDICYILENHGYTILERVRDYNDRERALLAQLVGKEEN